MPVRPISQKARSRVGLYAGLAAVVAIAVGGYFALRSFPASPAARPAITPVGAAANAGTAALQKSLDEAKRLFDDGKYEESLVIVRPVLDQDPGNAPARQLADQAERAIAGRAEQAVRTAQIETSLESARNAFSSKKWEEAKTHSGEVLLLDAENAEAIKLRDDSTVQAERAAAAEKKKVEAQLAKIRAMPKTPLPVQKAEAQGPAAPPPVPAGTSRATLRLLFDSPIPEGHVMVAVNDQILLRRPYSFKKKSGLFKSAEGTGTVSANIPVPNGPVTVKVWLSGPGISPAYATATASMMPAETRTLKIDYAGGNLGARVQ